MRAFKWTPLKVECEPPNNPLRNKLYQAARLPMPPVLNIIGCGKLGQTLAKLWHQQRVFSIGKILNRSLTSAQAAVEFIGAGQAVATSDQLTHADSWLIATDDQAIGPCIDQLAVNAPIQPGDSVFHCSGALSSEQLISAKHRGAVIASAHPVHSFADPHQSLISFAGSYCALEGDTQAVAHLTTAFEAIGAETISIDASHKLLYHGASVIACNYLVPLLDASLQCLLKAGIERTQATQLLSPMIHNTVDNLFQHDSASALTGPIARGDAATVSAQLSALKQQLPEFTDLYRSLGLLTVNIARQQAQASAEDLNLIQQTLSSSSSNEVDSQQTKKY